MSSKITFVGAGSYGFTYKLVNDILAKPELFDCDFAFVDIDEKRLESVKILTTKLFDQIGYKKNSVYTLNLEEGLTGTDFVINTVKIGFLEASIIDMDIPKKFGLYQSIGDTSTIAGVSRGLRTMVFNETLLKTMEKVSNKNAVVLNYTNPQPMCVMAAAATSKIPFIGLCHSVQGTTIQMAKYVEENYEDISYKGAGINHLVFIEEFKKGNEDLYPKFKEAVKKELVDYKSSSEQIFNSFGKTRIDLMDRVGKMVTESSTHLPEYVPFYLRTAELREKYSIEVDRFRQNIANSTKRYQAMLEKAIDGELEIPKPSVEYGPEIIYSMVTDKPTKVYANVMNNGIITNLPDYACVEVACLVDRNGVQPCYYGEMEWQLAALCNMEINVHKLAAEAVIKRDPKYVYWAFLSDPVAHSILDADQIKQVTNEILAAHKEYLPIFD